MDRLVKAMDEGQRGHGLCMSNRTTLDLFLQKQRREGPLFPRSAQNAP
jgi:hypothetical protein